MSPGEKIRFALGEGWAQRVQGGSRNVLEAFQLQVGCLVHSVRLKRRGCSATVRYTLLAVPLYRSITVGWCWLLTSIQLHTMIPGIVRTSLWLTPYQVSAFQSHWFWFISYLVSSPLLPLLEEWTWVFSFSIVQKSRQMLLPFMCKSPRYPVQKTL